MKAAILGQEGTWHVAALQAALARRGIQAPSFPVTRLTARLVSRPRLSAGGLALDDCDIVFVRAIPGGSLEQVIFRVDALHSLENSGVRIINSPTTIERTVDKYYTSTLLEDAGLPTPRTVVAESFDEAMAAFHELGGDVVVKPLFGSEGRGMVRVTDPDTAYRVLRALELGRYIYYLQQFTPHGCEDIRVFVIGGRAVAAMLRKGQTWKTNVAQGARPVPLEPDDALRDLATRAARALGADYAGVDILALEAGGYSVIEVNGIPGWQGIQEATGLDIGDRLVEYALAEIQGKRSG
jgi:RimK family alpha-L-glutamate ligase